jgi:two-component system, chemotaxis family, CheB/CheR fusion protein
MPRSAIATGVADFVLPLRELAARLVELIAKKQRTAEAGEFDQELLGRIFGQVSLRTGHDLSKYRRSTVLRRIERRIQVTRSDDLQGFYEFLRANVDEAQSLLNDMLISVTTFFRDAEVFELLGTRIVPQLFGGERNEQIRIWVPGCACGEEAYTIAILLLEEASQQQIRPPIQVFGSDLDTRALAMAREGRYPTAIEVDVNQERLRRFFIREGDHYRVRQDLRDIVLFANHNLLKDPPFSRIDLVSCRNVLIYLDHEVQDEVLKTLYYALNGGGYLLLGPTESADRPQGLFRVIDHDQDARWCRLFESPPMCRDLTHRHTWVYARAVSGVPSRARVADAAWCWSKARCSAALNSARNSDRIRSTMSPVIRTAYRLSISASVLREVQDLMRCASACAFSVGAAVD